jgi:histidyl-tRNA synthetase
MGHAAHARAAALAREMRTIGNPIEVAPAEMKLSKALEATSKLGVKYVLIIGDRELAENRFQLRNMTSGEQWAVTTEELFELYSNCHPGLRDGTLRANNMREKTE